MLAPVPKLYFPAWQFWQGPADPVPAMNVPASQKSQDKTPSEEE